MLNWPWTKWSSVLKTLQNRKKEAEEHPERLISFTCVSDLLDDLKSYKPSIFRKTQWWLNDVVWEVYRFFRPCHQQIRKSIPRRWVDISTLIETVNFEFIKSFHDNEMHIIDWDSNESHREFKEWIDNAYIYITKGRSELEKQLSAAYPPLKRKGEYKDLYAEVNRLEKLIEDKDTEILLEMVKRRGMFWS